MIDYIIPGRFQDSTVRGRGRIIRLVAICESVIQCFRGAKRLKWTRKYMFPCEVGIVAAHGGVAAEINVSL